MRHLLFTLLLLPTLVFANKQMSDAQIRAAIVKESVAKYKGACPCPYSTHPDGTQCGYRSAFHKNPAAKPMCYEINVTLKMVEEYRLKQALLSVDPNLEFSSSKDKPK
jgi:hypothetical protein